MGSFILSPMPLSIARLATLGSWQPIRPRALAWCAGSVPMRASSGELVASLSLSESARRWQTATSTSMRMNSTSDEFWRGRGQCGAADYNRAVFIVECACAPESSQALLFSEATCQESRMAEAAGHGRGGLCTWVWSLCPVWSPLPPGLILSSRGKVRREMSHLGSCCAGQSIFVRFSSSQVKVYSSRGQK